MTSGVHRRHTIADRGDAEASHLWKYRWRSLLLVYSSSTLRLWLALAGARRLLLHRFPELGPLVYLGLEQLAMVVVGSTVLLRIENSDKRDPHHETEPEYQIT